MQFINGLDDLESIIPEINVDVILKNKSLEMRIKKNGHIQILNKNDELIKVLSDMLTVIRQAVVYTCNGPQHLRHHLFRHVHARLRTFLEK